MKYIHLILLGSFYGKLGNENFILAIIGGYDDLKSSAYIHINSQQLWMRHDTQQGEEDWLVSPTTIPLKTNVHDLISHVPGGHRSRPL